MVFTDYTKRGILCHHAEGYRAPTIVKLLAAKERGVYAFSKRTGGIARCAGSGRPTKIMNAIVESEMRADTSIILLAYDWENSLT